MNSTELVRGLAYTATLSWRNYRTLYPVKIFLLSTLPRAVLQVAFFSYLGYLSGGVPGQSFALVGACVHIMAISTVIKGSDVLVDERQMGTLYRIRLGLVPLPVVSVVRWTVFAAEGVVCALVAALVVGPVLGRPGDTLTVLAGLPLVAVIAVSTSCFGMTVAAGAMYARSDLLWTNTASYALLVLCGVVAPEVGLPARFLPITNGLLALRDAAAGRPWVGEAALELAVGAGWLLVAVLVLRHQDHRARIAGSDDSF